MLADTDYRGALEALDPEHKLELLEGSWPEHVAKLEAVVRQVAEVRVGKDTEEWCPVVHTFKGGYYFRELTSPAGVLGISRIHRMKNTWTLLEGTVTVWSEQGVQTIEAPSFGVTVPGTKRVFYPHTPVRFVTVHELSEMSVEEAEAAIFADTFSELEASCQD